MSGKVYVCGINTSQLPKLTAKESQEYLVKISNGDETAREDFIVANMRLVLSIIKRFWAKKISHDDVFQAGVVGLIKAVDNFDLKYNVMFSTYAVPMIIGEIKRYLKGGNSLRIARSIRDTANKALLIRSELEKTNNDVTIEAVAEKMNVKLSEVVYSLDAISDTVSLFDPVASKDGDDLLLMDKLPDTKNTDEHWTEKLAIQNALVNLKKREKKIIYLRYFLGKTQTEISDIVGISQAQVSRIEKTALGSIKQKIKA